MRKLEQGVTGQGPFDSAFLFKMARDPRRWMELMAFVRRYKLHAKSKGGSWGETLLHWAAISDMAALMDLPAMGADVGAIDSEGRRPADWAFEKMLFMAEDVSISKAAMSLQESLTRIVCDLCLPETDTKPAGMSWGELAARACSISVLSALHEKNRTGSTPAGLTRAWASGMVTGKKSDDMLSWLKTSFNGVDDRGEDGLTALGVLCVLFLDKRHRAAAAEKGRALVREGADPYSEEDNGETVFERLLRERGEASRKDLNEWAAILDGEQTAV